MQTEQVADENKESPLPGLMAGKIFLTVMTKEAFSILNCETVVIPLFYTQITSWTIKA